jgi:hypothetical protein
MPSIPGYEWYVQHHTTSSGGLACLIHHSIAACVIDAAHPTYAAVASTTRIADGVDDSSAVMWLELRPPGWTHSILVAVTYLRPPATPALVTRLLTSLYTASSLLPPDTPLLLLGDLNLHHEQWCNAVLTTDPAADHFQSELDRLHLTVLNPLLLGPTQYTRPRSRAVLDVAVTNDAGLAYFTAMSLGIPTLHSDHLPITVHCRPPSDSYLLPSPCHVVPRIDWRLESFDHPEHQHQFASVLDQMLRIHFPFDLLDTIMQDGVRIHPSIIQCCLDHCTAQLQWCMEETARGTIGIKHRTNRSVPWWTPQVNAAYARLQHTHHAWFKHRGSATHEQAFRQAQKEWHEIKAEAKKESWRLFCHSLQSKCRSPLLWSVFRHSRSSSSSSSSRFSSLSSIPHPLTGQLPSSLHESLNHFTSQLLAAATPPCPLPLHIASETERLMEEQLRKYEQDELEEDESNAWVFSVEDVRQQCQRQHTDTAAGSDSISALMLKYAGSGECEELYRALSLLFTASWKYGVLPQQWTEANVCALYKGKGPRHAASSYRPISVTSVVIRTFEHLIHHRLSDRLERQGSFHVTQFGFRPHRSTEDALFYLQTTLYRYLRSRPDQPVPVVFLDLKKAFDRVNHPRLLYLLHQRARIRGRAWNWLRAFLSRRRIRTVQHGTCSDWHWIDNSVPQGAVLSPVLFAQFIDEAPRRLQQTAPCIPLPPSNSADPHGTGPGTPYTLLDFVHIILFADDVAVLPNLDVAARAGLPRHAWTVLFQQALNVLSEWAVENQMEFSADKSAVVTFSRSPTRRALFQRLYHWYIGGFELQQASHYTYLGIIHDY